MTRPRAPKDSPAIPVAETDGGGATICVSAEAGGWRSGTRRDSLFGDRKLGRGRDHRAPPDVQIADRATGCGLDARGRRNHRKAAGPEPAPFEARKSGGGATTEFCNAGELPRCERRAASGGGASAEFSILRRDPVDVGSRGQRHIGNFKPRLLHLVRPGHNVWQRNIVLQFDFGRRDDGLRPVVGFGRKRNDRLAGEFRISFTRRCTTSRAAGVDGREIFRRLVINHLVVVEGWPRHDLRLKREEAGKANEQRERDDMISARLQEPVPRKRPCYEHVGPERSWSRPQFEWRKLRRRDEVAQVADEYFAPRGQLDQKPRNGRGLRDFDDRWGSNHSTYTSYLY